MNTENLIEEEEEFLAKIQYRVPTNSNNWYSSYVSSLSDLITKNGNSSYRFVLTNSTKELSGLVMNKRVFGLNIKTVAATA